MLNMYKIIKLKKQRGGHRYGIDIQDAIEKDIVRVTNISDLYAVSRDGDVFRTKSGPGTIPGQIITPWVESHGYFKVTIKRLHYFVHRLVLTSFCRPPLDGEEANHIDGDKQNNFIKNLEWVTHSGNMSHAYLTGLNIPRCGEKHPMSKLKLHDVIEIKRKLKRYKHGMVSSLAREYGVTKYAISDIKTGRSWSWT